jgi:hypothetical protein
MRRGRLGRLNSMRGGEGLAGVEKALRVEPGARVGK